MAKKEKPAELEINSRKELDEKLAKAIEDTKNKPTDEEVEEAKKKFEKESKNFDINFWDIGELEDAQVFLDYFQQFVINRLFWNQNGWMGVIKMNEELNEAENFIKGNPNAHFKLGYQALEFMFYSLQNPGGVGLQTALDFEEENKIYAKLFDVVSKQVEIARKELKEVQLLQDQYAAMAQGFYLEIEPDGPVVEDKVEDKVEDEVEENEPEETKPKEKVKKPVPPKGEILTEGEESLGEKED